MVLVWTALSFSAPSKVASGVPRRLFSPLPWNFNSLHHWTVIQVKCISKLLLVFLFAFSSGPFFFLQDCQWKSLEIHVLVNAGYGAGSSYKHLCCFYSCRDDSGALLFWPQCGFSIGSAEGVQTKEPFILPLWHLVAWFHGIFHQLHSLTS